MDWRAKSNEKGERKRGRRKIERESKHRQAFNRPEEGKTKEEERWRDKL